jgi:dephospho-CoA kinase
MIIVLAGRVASGKSTIAKSAANLAGASRTSFGDYVRHLAEERGLDATKRETLQDLGQSHVQADVRGFVRAFLEFSSYKPGELLIVDGLRHEAVLAALREHVQQSQDQLGLAFIDVTDEVRLSRLRDRGLDEEAISAIERHVSEHDVLTSLRQEADLIVSGETDPAVAAESLLQLHPRQRR